MTASLTCSHSGPEPPTAAVIACGALAHDIIRIADENGWPLVVHGLPPLLHNRPQGIAPAVSELAAQLCARYATVAVAYADCGTYGALDAVCERFGLRRLGGSHCYDVLAGVSRMSALLAEEPGTYVLTDFLVRSFARTVVRELGLDRYPQLREDYFRHYRRVVWLAQHPTAELAASAEAAAASLGLPLTVIRVTDELLVRELRQLLGRE
jgi:hypothetical protein